MNIEENDNETVQNENAASDEIVTNMTIGEYLRSAREEKNLSLKVISQHTKISVTILENIENNNFNNLPSKAYVTGFIKSYSKTISLDEAECLQLLNEAYGSFPEATARPVLTPREDITKASGSVETTESKDSHTQLLTVAGVFVALIILFAIVVYNTSDGPNKEASIDQETIEKEVNQTPLVDVQPQQLSESTPLTEKVKESVAKVLPEETPAIVEEEDEAEEEIAVKEEEVKKVEDNSKKKEIEKEKEKITLRPIPTPLYEITKDEEAYTHLPLSVKASYIEGKQNIFINAVDGDTWITYKSDDDDIKKFVLSKGRTLLIRGDVIRIFLGNVHVARIFLNNEALKIASRSGVKSLVFPEEKVSDFKLPLFLYPKPGIVMTSSEYEESL